MFEELMHCTWWTWSSTLHAPLPLGQVRQGPLRGKICTPRHTKIACSTHTLDPATPEEDICSLSSEPQDALHTRMKHIHTHKTIEKTLKCMLH